MLVVSVDQSLADDVVVAEFGWWEGNLDLGLPQLDVLSPRGSNFNSLVSGEASDPVVGSVQLRSARCTLAAPPEPRTWAGRKAFTVCEVARRTDDIKSVVLRPADNAALPDFVAGQHLEVLLPGKSEHTRKYSLTGSAVAVDGEYEIAVKKIPGGQVSPFVHELSTGDVVQCSPPSGTFTIPHADHPCPLVFIAIGVGITPFISALRTIAHHTDPSRHPRIELVYSARDTDNLAYAEEIAEIAELLGSAFRMSVYLTRQTDTPPAVAKGCSVVFRRLTSMDSSNDLIAEGARFYYCGPVEVAQTFKRDLVCRGPGALPVLQRVLLRRTARLRTAHERRDGDLRTIGQNSALVRK